MCWKNVVSAFVFCVAVAFGLSLSAAETSVEELVAALNSGEQSTRLHAMDHLAARGAKASSAVEPLTALLEDKSTPVRAHAAHALGKIGAASKSAVPDLMELVKDADPLVRSQALQAILAIHPGSQVTIPLCIDLLKKADPTSQQRVLAAISAAGPQAVPALIEALQNEDAVFWACIVLREMGPDGKDAVPALAELLKSPRPEIRREAVLALGAMGTASSDVAPQIAELLTDKHAAVAATYALGRIGKLSPAATETIGRNIQNEDLMLSTMSIWAYTATHLDNDEIRERATEKLIQRLSNSDPYVRLAASRGLAALPPAPEITLPIWEKTLADADETTMAHAIDALVRIGGPAVPQLVKALEFEGLRPQVIDVLQQLGPAAESATLPLASLIGDSNEHIAHSAILALASIGPAAKLATPALLQALGEKDNSRQHAIVFALGKIGPSALEAQGPLLKLLAGSNQELALISAWALTKIDASPATVAKVVPVLTAGLSADSPVARRGAAESLGELGKLGKPALPALEGALQDKDETVREAAKKALASISE